MFLLDRLDFYLKSKKKILVANANVKISYPLDAAQIWISLESFGYGQHCIRFDKHLLTPLVLSTQKSTTLAGIVYYVFRSLKKLMTDQDGKCNKQVKEKNKHSHYKWNKVLWIENRLTPNCIRPAVSCLFQLKDRPWGESILP